ncbi:Endonuclease/exonuclease/phosphatase [Flagelloscypha sp. PMI_526]|nr:Endonuclease/exonuclease/phosphatase [Flagelloscypha sp. PMI_526]
MSLRLLTLNCWDLKYIAHNRLERVNAIADRVSSSPYDVVGFQGINIQPSFQPLVLLFLIYVELWVLADYELVKQRCRQFQYSKFFYSGALGSGLVIFSRFPIVETSCHPYSLNGEPLDVAAGDWFVGKAAVSIVIDHPDFGLTQIFNTHLFAKGGEDGPEHRRAHRLLNAWELSKLTLQAAQLGRNVIVLGDFNSTPETLPMKLILEHTGMTDAWSFTHPSPARTQPSTPQQAISMFGVTADSPLNTYSAGKPLDKYARRFGGKRLDYVLYRNAVSASSQSLRCTQCAVVLTETVPGHGFSYSDHFGLEATLVLDSSDSESTLSPQSNVSRSPTTISATKQALLACHRFSQHRAYRELIVCGVCILVLLGILFGSAWQPKSWLSPVFILFTIFLSWLATTMFYSSFLYGKWECNALMTCVEELELELSRREQDDLPPRLSYQVNLQDD